MKKRDALEFFESHKQIFLNQFGVSRLALFGSTMRDEASEDSDLDVLVDFVGGETFRNYFDLLFYLEDHLKCKVDLVCRDAVRPQLKKHIESEAIDVA
jgi:uncharacterized protein